MAETSPQIQERSKDLEEDVVTPDVQNVGMKIQRGADMYKDYAGLEEKPTKGEVLVWYLYGLCSYFVHTVLIPIVFPLIISQTVPGASEPNQGWLKSHKGLKCKQSEMQLYEGLVYRAVEVGSLNFSPLHWTSISWITGLVLSAPILGFVSVNLDYGHNQQLIAGAATGIGALFCLPAGFFKKSLIFPPYIAVIVAASTIVGATHARHLGLMIRGFTGSTIRKRQFADRRSFGSWLSLYSTAAGCLGAAIMASFTYHMLSQSDHFTALWVVSIFSGLIWGIGMIHIFSTNRATSSYADWLSNSNPLIHVLSIFKYPQAAGSLAGVFLSSFATTCVFAGGLLYAIGYLCIKTESILYLWLAYFVCPLLSLPLAHPLQQIMRADAEKMQLLGFILSTFTSGFGFYYKTSIWSTGSILLFAAIQGSAAGGIVIIYEKAKHTLQESASCGATELTTSLTGLLHAFGRVLWLDCSPVGNEGAFSVWFSWARALGACAGFALATALPGKIGKTFGVSFCAGMIGMIIVIFGNIRSFRGAKAAGHVIRSENASPLHKHEAGSDYTKGSVTMEDPTQRKVEV